VSIQSILAELANLNPPQSAFNSNSVKQALHLLGNPQQHYSVIHIAGTNGKGSSAAFLESGLLAAGYRVGKYTSPYIQALNECIVLNQQTISDDELVAIYLELKHQLLTPQIHLSSFEMLTVIMFIYFARQSIDYLVLETGLGGLNDATNVVDSQYSLITNISLEHTQWLGNSLAGIAEHKAGIIHGGSCVIADETPELLAAVAKRTSKWSNVLSKYSYRSCVNYHSFTTQVWFNLRGESLDKYVELGLFGHFQVRNFLLAYEVLHELGIHDDVIFAAIRNTSWPGRLQRISRAPLIIADASHNAVGCANLRDSLHDLVRPEECVIIASILKDKDAAVMLDYYAQLADTLVCCNLPQQPRATPALSLAKGARGKFKNIHVYNSPLNALQVAKRLHKKVIIISGSTYLLKYFIE
jgi:dihydrofolate synthase/folylpolyglutamate synthase